MKPEIEYQIVEDDDGHSYVVRTDEVQVFEHWLAAMNGKRHFPADFSPFRLDSIYQLRFKEWREET